MATNHQIEQMWTAGRRNGFLTADIPESTHAVADLPHPAMELIGTKSPTLASSSAKEIDELVADLGGCPDSEFGALSAGMTEAVLRCYVSIAAHLIHRPGLAERRALPRAVARPLWELSQIVDRPPSLTYASYVLSNFTTPVAPRTAAADFAVGQTPSGTADEEWFIAVHQSVESVGGEVVAAVDAIDVGLTEQDGAALSNALDSIESCLDFAVRTMPTIRERLDPEVFRDEIRPLLYGHDVITFEGVHGAPQVSYIGETGAQSGVIRAADALLGTRHTPGMVTSMNRFLDCAPPWHQRYLIKVAGIGSKLAQAELPTRIREARRRALCALTEFRRVHLSVVTDYLAPEGTSLSERGTGGTHFQVWLQRLIDETDEAVKSA